MNNKISIGGIGGIGNSRRGAAVELFQDGSYSNTVAGHVGCPVSDRVTPPKSIAHELPLAHLPSKNATGLRRFNDVVCRRLGGGVSSARAVVSVHGESLYVAPYSHLLVALSPCKIML
jgi:hypothetical protein